MADFWGLVLAFAYTAGGIVCHQLPERSFELAGRQLPVCARCTGLYASAGLGLLGWLLMRHLVRPGVLGTPRQLLGWLAVAAAPTAVSWTTGVLGVWDGSNVMRAALAVPLGLAVGAVAGAVAAKDLR